MALLEALCETIARRGLQQNIPDSTKFLMALNNEDFVTMADLDHNGRSTYSVEPIIYNRAYASIYLAGLYLANRLGFDKQSGKVDYGFGTQKLLDLFWSQEQAKLMTKVAEAASIPYDELYGSIEPIIKGQTILRNFSEHSDQ